MQPLIGPVFTFNLAPLSFPVTNKSIEWILAMDLLCLAVHATTSVTLKTNNKKYLIFMTYSHAEVKFDGLPASRLVS